MRAETQYAMDYRSMGPRVIDQCSTPRPGQLSFWVPLLYPPHIVSYNQPFNHRQS
ncbi:uncharacterized protein METZ01_LOCUS199589 [marine metagenome]|uniref:Uncharacterized protein n=1 Tax=marine metagenome TaxID=408172 RepID=A0A382E8E2_9ZZZZ